MRRLDNDEARRLFLDRHALLEQPTGPGKGADLDALIHRLGFVQIDSISTVERAHHMILFARRPAYRPRNLAPLLERDRTLFEHWTHDAAIIPTAFYPQWKLRFERDAERLRRQWRLWRREGFEAQFDTVLEHIRDYGPVCSADVGKHEPRSKGGWWDWHPSKTALEYLWRTGALAVTRREAFRKVYDLSERVIPDPHRTTTPHAPDCIDWLCGEALDRLGFATPGELSAFWDTVSNTEARTWVQEALAQGRIEEIEVIGADGQPRRSVARPGVVDAARALPEAPGRMRVLSPFDPALRDRQRAERLFDFAYRIEIFVPAAKRRYGYYVFPLLEGARLVGRIDMKTDRASDTLQVSALWPERGVRWGQGRQARLEAELERVARFAGVAEVRFQDGWVRAGQ